MAAKIIAAVLGALCVVLMHQVLRPDEVRDCVFGVAIVWLLIVQIRTSREDGRNHADPT